MFLAAATVSQACALIRYTVLARLLGPEQLGLAATVILTQSFFDMISDSGIDRFLIQYDHGDTVEVQKLAQLVFLGRGLFTAIGLIVFAYPVARFYHAPMLAPALMFLAVSPLIAGTVHLDLRRIQRGNDFRTEGWGTLIGESLALAATLAAAFSLHSFVAVVFGSITRSLVVTIVSHWRAERPFRLGLSRLHGPHLARFALPLMFNGLLLFFGTQGDRILIANRLGLRDLGLYSATILLIYYPSAMMLRYISTMHLPRIALARNELEADRASDRLGGLTQVVALALVAGFAIVAPAAVPILFGRKFQQTVVIFSLVGILQSVRFLRLWPHTVALGRGRTGIILADNTTRLLAYPAAFVGIMLVHNLTAVILGFIVGELVAYCVGLIMVNRSDSRPWWLGADRVLVFVSACATITLWAWALETRTYWPTIILAPVTAALGFAVVKRETVTITGSFDLVRRWATQFAAPGRGLTLLGLRFVKGKKP